MLNTLHFYFSPQTFIKSPIGKSLWRKKSKEFLSKYQNCYVCGSKKDRHVHHINPKGQNPRLTYRDYNLVVLCKQCHLTHPNSWHKTHGYKKGNMKMFLNWVKSRA